MSRIAIYSLENCVHCVWCVHCVGFWPWRLGYCVRWKMPAYYVYIGCLIPMIWLINPLQCFPPYFFCFINWGSFVVYWLIRGLLVGNDIPVEQLNWSYFKRIMNTNMGIFSPLYRNHASIQYYMHCHIYYAPYACSVAGRSRAGNHE